MKPFRVQSLFHIYTCVITIITVYLIALYMTNIVARVVHVAVSAILNCFCNKISYSLVVTRWFVMYLLPSRSLNVSWIVVFPPVFRLTVSARRRMSYWIPSDHYRNLPSTSDLQNLHVTNVHSKPNQEEENRKWQTVKKRFEQERRQQKRDAIREANERMQKQKKRLEQERQQKKRDAIREANERMQKQKKRLEYERRHWQTVKKANNKACKQYKANINKGFTNLLATIPSISHNPITPTLDILEQTIRFIGFLKNQEQCLEQEACNERRRRFLLECRLKELMY